MGSLKNESRHYRLTRYPWRHWKRIFRDSHRPAQVLSLAQIPYCSGGASSPRLSDKQKYPYLYRPLLARGLGEHLSQVLETWNVKRVAFVYQRDDEMSSQYFLDIKGSLLRHGILLVVELPLPTLLSYDVIGFAKASLDRAQARYIILSGQTYFNAAFYNHMADVGMVNERMVWIGFNPVTITGQNISQSTYKNARGFIYINGRFPSQDVPIVQQYYEETLRVSQLTNTALSLSDLFLNLAVAQMFDCAMMMLIGYVGNQKTAKPYELHAFSEFRL
ncbi:hypothetical protein BCR33DRAFT_451003 [Rhizoclosmatium globosum]|uniref:Receptor ligand binding region domain-containing protein n=1 Tax=Rhizoclosmatium globosum TaxID=329046 RepID=A0A1Y2CWK6_9FUNG|nr:hypothetical protein BCR33DRAFT_451003 [Rhizoclosmatium globosum]|eukprot:ORY51266.1 hypothetical protein BCR33DRAFT_451003 [Rhizoclosmatium globosum]